MLYISTLWNGHRYTGIWGHHPTQRHYASTVSDGTQCYLVKRQRDARAFEHVTQYTVDGIRLTKTNEQPVWKIKL